MRNANLLIATAAFVVLSFEAGYRATSATSINIGGIASDAAINEARKHERRCGRKKMSAAPALKLSAALTRAAATHASDMAANSFMGHHS